MGRKKLPFYRIVAVDSRVRRDGAPLEYLGWYDPLKKEANLNAPAIKKWLSGACGRVQWECGRVDGWVGMRQWSWRPAGQWAGIRACRGGSIINLCAGRRELGAALNRCHACADSH